MLAALPSICILNRRNLHYLWTFREYFAEKSIDGPMRINAHLKNDFKVKTFLLSLDIPDVYEKVMAFWKDKVR